MPAIQRVPWVLLARPKERSHTVAAPAVPSPRQHAWCPFVPRPEGPPHPVHPAGRVAYHRGLRGLHLLRMLQAPQPSELQGGGPAAGRGRCRPGRRSPPCHTPVCRPPSPDCVYPRGRRGWPGAMCGLPSHLFLAPRAPAPPSSAAGSLVPAGTVIPGVNHLFVWRVLVRGNGFVGHGESLPADGGLGEWQRK